MMPDASDNELLMRFVRHRDEAAFRQLVQRHAPIVMGVCRQTARDHQDAEDAFQETLIILARNSRRLLRVASLGGWLHRVAYRTAVRSRHRHARRREESLATQPDSSQPASLLAELSRIEIQRILHEEIQRLPTRYREVIVLCDLQQKSRRQVAERIDSTESAVKAALARGRRKLRMQLLRRGVAMSAAVGLAQHAIASVRVPPYVLDRSVDVCLNPGSAHSTQRSPFSAAAEQGVTMSSTARTFALLVITGLVFLIPVLLAGQINVDARTVPDVITVDRTDATVTTDQTGDASAVTVAQVESPEPSTSEATENTASAVNAPSVPATRATATYQLDAGTFLVTSTPDSNAFLAYNKQTGRWTRHEFSRELHVTPIIAAGGVSAFSFKGGPVTELVAIDAQGRFCVHKLSEAVNQPIEPFVGSGLAYYIFDGAVFAFSGETGTWDALKAPHVEWRKLSTDSGMSITSLQGMQNSLDGILVVEFQDRIAAFSRESGKWTAAEFEVSDHDDTKDSGLSSNGDEGVNAVK